MASLGHGRPQQQQQQAQYQQLQHYTQQYQAQQQAVFGLGGSDPVNQFAQILRGGAAGATAAAVGGAAGGGDVTGNAYQQLRHGPMAGAGSGAGMLPYAGVAAAGAAELQRQHQLQVQQQQQQQQQHQMGSSDRFMYSTTTVAPGSAHAGSLASDTTNEASPAAKPTAAPGGGSTAATGAAGGDIAYQLIGRLPNPKERESVLAELSRRREDHPDLAVVLWNSCGTSAILVQEIVAAYAWLHPPLLTMTASNRICNALALLQLVATHAETRARFLRSSIPQLLYPLLATTHKSRPFDNLRLTSLGVIGAIVKHDSPEVVQYLIQTEFIPLCLKILEIGTELCKIVAIFVFQRIINDPTGLTYMVDHPTRLLTMLAVLAVIIEQLLKFKSPRLLKSVIRLYIRLAEHPDVLTYLRENLPTELRDATFLSMLEEEPSAKKSLVQLLTKLYGSEVATVATTTGLSNVNLANPHHQHLHQQQQQQLHQQALQPPPGITTA